MFRHFLATFLVFLLLTGCASRLPSPATSQKVIAKYFKKYGKKYRETDFGQFKVQTVELASTEELQKNWASAEAFVYLTNGPVYRVRFTLQKKAFGWRYQSWENYGKK